MRIASIDVISLKAPGPKHLVDSSFFNTLVRIKTSDGLVGYGESEGIPSIIKAIVDAETIHPFAHGLRSLIVGQLLDDPAALQARMVEATSYYGRRGAAMIAISAVEMALWDIRGKAGGVPISKLLGGAKRSKLPAYVSAYPLGNTADTVREALDIVLAHNPRAIKLCAEADWAGSDGSERMVRAIETARAHCGKGMPLMVDMYGAWKRAADARKALPALAEHSIKWLEAPLSLDDLDGYASLQGFGVAIAAGDLGATSALEFEALLDRGKVDIVQPDLTVAGGFTEVRKIGALVKKRKKRMLMHHYKSDLLLAANLHIMSVAPKEDVVEYSLSPSPLRNDLTKRRIEVDKDGYVHVPEAPGLGVDINQKTVSRFTVQ